MKLLFKQRFFSWFDSYDIYDENENRVFTVKGELSWGHLLRIYDANGHEVGYIKQRVFSFFSTFEIYEGDDYLGCIRRQFTLFKPKYTIEYNNWSVEGDMFEWDYSIVSQNGDIIATISKELFRLTDTYVLDITYPSDALYVLMFVLAVDAEKCSRQNN